MNKKQVIAVFVTVILIAGISVYAVCRLRDMSVLVQRPPRTSYERRIAEYKKAFGREAAIVYRRYSPQQIIRQQIIFLAAIGGVLLLGAGVVFILRDKKEA